MLICCFAVLPAVSQSVSMEHEYPEGRARRVVLENSGAKYYVVDHAGQQINFYHADHSFWKSVSFDLPIPYWFEMIHVSEATIDSDPAIEIAFSYWLNPFRIGGSSMIIRDDGAELMSDVALYQFSTIGGSTKMLVPGDGTTAVYTMPLGSPVIAEGIVQRVALDVSGEKYVRFNPGLAAFELLHPDLSVWKTIPFSLSTAVPEVHGFSEHWLDGDNDVEVALSWTDPQSGDSTAAVIDETGQVLLLVPDGNKIDMSTLPGFANKLMVRCGDSFPYTKVYSAPSLALEHQYGHEVSRISLPVGGEVYVEGIDQTTGPSVKVNLYANHQFWKSIDLTMEGASEGLVSVEVSQHRYATDDLLEVAFTTRNITLLDSNYHHSGIVNELGTVLLSVPDAVGLLYDHQVPESPKLIADLGPDVALMPFNRRGTVYAVSPDMSVYDVSENVRLYPNPASGEVYLQSDVGIERAEVLAVTGEVLRRNTVDRAGRIALDGLSKGVYLVRLYADNGVVIVEKLVVR